MSFSHRAGIPNAFGKVLMTFQLKSILFLSLNCALTTVMGFSFLFFSVSALAMPHTQVRPAKEAIRLILPFDIW